MAKKKYLARVLDSEGIRYKENDPYMKIQGLEIKQGGVSKFTKDYLKDCIPIILDQGDIYDWLSKIWNDTYKSFGERLFECRIC